MSFGYSLVTLGHFATTWVTFQLNLAGCTTGASATWDTLQLDGHFTTVWVALQLFGPLCNLVFFRIFRLGSLYNQFGSLHNQLEPLCFWGFPDLDHSTTSWGSSQLPWATLHRIWVTLQPTSPDHYVCIHVRMYACMHVRIFVCMSACTCLCVCMCLCLCVCGSVTVSLCVSQAWMVSTKGFCWCVHALHLVTLILIAR